MADSIRERVLQAVVALLGVAQPGEAAVPTIGRSPSAATEATRLPRQDVLLAAPPERLGEVVNNDWVSGDQVERTFTFAVVSRFTSPAAGDPIDQVGDPYVTRAVVALMPDYTLGGLTLDLRELGTEWVRPEGTELRPSLRHGEAWTYFEAKYETKRTDPTAAPS